MCWFQITCLPFYVNIISLIQIANLYFSFLCVYIIINFKTTHVKTWVKISEVMPEPKSIPPGK